MRSVLTRIDQDAARSLGVWTYGSKFWTTVERPWLDNAPNISCIPEGIYPMRRFSVVHGYRSSKGIGDEDVWEICEVPNRTVILVHVANYPYNVEGCTGLGMGILTSRSGVASSRKAITEFYEATKGVEEMELEVKS